MHRAVRLVLIVLAAVATPSVLFAQAVVTGVVKDASGAVLPGVTVEAASPALIEKVRSATTDGSGQYRIVDLRPGSYDVSFTLAGFSTVKREGIVLAGTATVTVNADLKVGAVTETITVTGASPLVDVQGVASEHSITRELLDSVPTGRTVHTMATLIPGLTVQGGSSNPNVADVGGSAIAVTPQAMIHGGSASDQRLLMDGLPIAAMGVSNATNFQINIASIQELTIDTAGLSAEDNSGGVRLNIVPREGGNQFRATVFADGSGPSLQSSNYTDDLKARGFPQPNPIKPLQTAYTINPAVGGPIMKDKLWFYAAVNRVHNATYVAVYPNKNAGNMNAWTYVPDPNGTFPSLDSLLYGENGRLTWQATPKNKLAFYLDGQGRCACPEANAALSPEAQPSGILPNAHFASLTYTAPISSRLVLDIAALDRLDGFRRSGALPIDPAMIPVTDTGTGITYRSYASETQRLLNRNQDLRGTVSLVTGAHAIKAGFQTEWTSNDATNGVNTQSVSYRFTNGVPNSITLFADPRQSINKANESGMFLQDRWTLKRLTLTGGLRYDFYNSYFPDQTAGPVLLAPTRNISFPAADGVRWHDITYRTGAAYDVMGNGKTAVKVSLNKYLAAMNTGTGTIGGYSFGAPLNPVNRVAISTTRSWNDANKNFTPDCNLLLATANGECGALANSSFGQAVVSTTYDPSILTGWGNRQYNTEFVAGVQQQVLERLAVEVSYLHRSYGNFVLTDNLSVAPSDFTQFSMVAPVDARLPNGGGQTISGLYDVNPGKFGQTNNFVTLSKNYGDVSHTWQGVDVSTNIRAMKGLTFQAGISTGSTAQDTCGVRALLPEWAQNGANSAFNATGPTIPYCNFSTLWLTQFKGLGTYNVPKVDVQVSAGFQSMPGPLVTADFNATNAFTQASLGRPLAGSVANVPVNLIPTGTLYGERMNTLDMRFSKLFHFAGRGRLSLNMDVFNTLNASTVIIQNNAYSPTTSTWQTPQTVIAGRLIKFGAQFDF